MDEKETYKLIGKLSGTIVFLTLIVFGLIITILVLFAFQKPLDDETSDKILAFCGTPYLNSNYGDPAYKNGEILFNQNCASCHFPDKDMTGPALNGARERGEENAYKMWIYDFIQNEDSLVQIEDAYTLKLREKWGWTNGEWSHRENLTKAEIDDLFNYIN
ncbi:MAG: hypothetical protein ACI8ZM_000989 [Crocinitomix sp.]|jgi:hypothetical protein